LIGADLVADDDEAIPKRFHVLGVVANALLLICLPVFSTL
jgi:hypothetical protein